MKNNLSPCRINLLIGGTMSQAMITESLKDLLGKFLKANKKPDLLTTYLYFLEQKHHLNPVLFLREKMIYQSAETLLKRLSDEGKLWRETEIKIQVGQPSVNEETKKVYICPFTGKVFGDNTHPNPQDAIYDWVSTCPENTERANGLKVKRFHVSEDPEIISNYIQKRKEPITKTVYSSGITGKLFNSKQAVIDDFVAHQLKRMSMVEVPSQNRYQIEESFMAFIQRNLEENKVAAFVEAMGECSEFKEFVTLWLEDQ